MWRRLRIGAWILGVFVILFLTRDFGNFLADTESERELPPVVNSEAIVVLAGDPNRIPSAVRLLRSRQSPILIISGTGKHTTLKDLLNQQTSQDTPLSEVWGKIRFESASTSTVENAKETKKLVETNRIGRIVLVTSSYHLPRAKEIFRTLIPDVEYRYYAVSGEAGIANSWRLGIEYGKLLVFKYNQWLVRTHIFPKVALQPNLDSLANKL